MWILFCGRRKRGYERFYKYGEAWFCMKDSEANKVLRIISLANGRCPYCAKEPLDLLNMGFPELGNIAKVYRKRNNIRLKKRGRFFKRGEIKNE